MHHNQAQLNHRMVVLQHKCIEPLGESKSDYQIFLEILNGLGLGRMFSEGCSELDWCKRVFDPPTCRSTLPGRSSSKKGYYVVPPEPEATRDPVDIRWFAEDRQKDMPEPQPLPSQYAEEFGKGWRPSRARSSSSQLRSNAADPDNPERPALNSTFRPGKGRTRRSCTRKYPLQMISTHSRYSFHTYGDGKDSTINDIDDHRVLIDGYYYWVMRINPIDAEKRGHQAP